MLVSPPTGAEEELPSSEEVASVPNHVLDPRETGMAGVVIVHDLADAIGAEAGMQVDEGRMADPEPSRPRISRKVRLDQTGARPP